MDHIKDDIFIGDKHEATDFNELDKESIVNILTLNDEKHDRTDYYCPIVDGENDQRDFDEAVETALDMFEKEWNTLIHCASGMSRSVTVVATALARREGMTLEEALEFVEERRPVANPHPDLLEHAERHLDKY